MNKEMMQDSGVEWIGKIPHRWHIDRLKDKTTLVVGGDWGDDPESESPGENVIVLRVADIQDRYFKVENLTIRKLKPVSLINRLVNERSILIEKSGGGEKQLVGRAAIPKSFSSNAICSNFMAKIDFDLSVDVEYVNFLLSSLYFQNLNYPYIQQTTGIQNLNVTYYLASKVLFPPKEEQKAIAQYLDQRCGKLDTIIAIKQQQIKTLDTLRQSIIYHAVTKGLDDSVQLVDSGVEWLGKIPHSWKPYRIKDVAKLSPTYSESKPDQEENCTVVPMECVSEKGNIDTSSLEQYKNISSGLTLFEKGDVIFAKITPCMENGKGAYIANLPTRYAFGSTEFHVLRNNHNLNGKFLYYYTYNNAFRNYAAVNMTGAAGQKRVSTNFLKYTVIYLPDISEQQHIVDHLDQETQRLNDLKANLSQQINTLQAYKKSLIYECVTGKKRIKADDLKAG